MKEKKDAQRVYKQKRETLQLYEEQEKERLRKIAEGREALEKEEALHKTEQEHIRRKQEEAEAKRKADEERQRRDRETERLYAEVLRRHKEQEEARRRAEQERQRREQEEARRRAEQERQQREQEEARRRAEQERQRRKRQQSRGQNEEAIIGLIKNAFDTFELPYDATFEDVKKKRIFLLKFFHPDHHYEDKEAERFATEKARKVNEAYEVLKMFFEAKNI